MHKVLVVGDANVDIIVPYPRFLNKTKTLVAYPTPSLQGGGTSANTATALARLGIPTAFMGTIGDDQYGKYIKEDFKREGVDTTALIVDPALNTVGVFAFIDENGERYLWGWPRVNQAFKELKKDNIDYDNIYKMSWIHSSGMSLVYDTSARSSIIEIFKNAWERNIPTSFDLNLRVDNGKIEPEYENAVREIIEYTSYLLGSGTDEFYYLGKPGDWRYNAQSFVTDRRTVIVRNGKAGSMAFTEENVIEMPAFSVKVEDTVGAGDVYNAGFISAKLLGYGMEQCLTIGNAVSAYTIERKGARSSPHLENLRAFLDKHKAVIDEKYL